jgi:hypothetical protein
MSVLTFRITSDGLHVPVLVGHDPARLLALLRTAGGPLPMPLRGRAILDTGANHTSVSPSFLAALGQPSSGSFQTGTPLGPAWVQSYRVSLTVYDPTNLGGPTLFREDWPVTNLPQDQKDFDVIIGMDLIKQIILHVDGPADWFTITF